jgi:heme exporter protein B
MWPIIEHEVKYYFKNKIELSYFYSFFISIILLVPFGFEAGSSLLQQFAPASLWIALTTTVTLFAAPLFSRDIQSGRLESLHWLPISPEKYVLAKWLALFGVVLLPILLLLPMLALLYGVEGGQMGRYAVGLSAGAAGLTLLAALASALMAGLERAGATLGLIVLPLSIPLMIFSVNYLRATDTVWHAGLLFQLGFVVFMLPILCLVGAYGIRASH